MGALGRGWITRVFKLAPSSDPPDSLGCVFSTRLCVFSAAQEPAGEQGHLIPSRQAKPPDSSGPWLLAAGLSC